MRLLVLVNRPNSSWQMHTANTLAFRRVLKGWIPYDIYPVENAPSDLSPYDGVILLWGRSSTVACQAWMRGDPTTTAGLPVLAVTRTWSNDLNKSLPNCETGADSSADLAGSAYPWALESGGSIKVVARPEIGVRCYTLNSYGQALYTVSGSDAQDGKAIIWKLAPRSGVNDQVYFSGLGDYYPVANILFFLGKIGVAPDFVTTFPKAVIICGDDAWGASPAGIPGQQALIDWLREKQTLILIGVDHATTNPDFMEDATVRALWLANTDVCKFVEHSHESETNNQTGKTPAEISADRAAIIATINERGFGVTADGYRGITYLPLDRGSIPGIQALALDGVKVLRTAVGASGAVTPMRGNRVTVRYHDLVTGKNYHLRTEKTLPLLVAQTTGHTKAVVIGALSPQSEARAVFNFQEYQCMKDLFRGGGLLSAGTGSVAAGDNNPGLLLETHMRNYNDITSTVPEWAAGDYQVGDLVKPTNFADPDINIAKNYKGRYYRCTRAGTSGPAEPGWSVATPSSPTDDTVDEGSPKCAWQSVHYGGDNPGLWALQTLDHYFVMSGGWLRWAQEEDLVRITGRRRKVA